MATDANRPQVRLLTDEDFATMRAERAEAQRASRNRGIRAARNAAAAGKAGACDDRILRAQERDFSRGIV